ncbi:MAG: hypothetical protein ABJM82_07505 [Shimia thalassica]
MKWLASLRATDKALTGEEFPWKLWISMNYVIALGIPVALIVIGGLVKKIVRGSTWQAADFFLGVELALSAVTSSLIYVFELSKSTDPSQKAAALGVYSVTSLFLFLIIVGFHQEWEKKPQDLRGQKIWLGGFCNLIGIGLISGFVLFVKGIQ